MEDADRLEKRLEFFTGSSHDWRARCADERLSIPVRGRLCYPQERDAIVSAMRLCNPIQGLERRDGLLQAVESSAPRRNAEVILERRRPELRRLRRVRETTVCCTTTAHRRLELSCRDHRTGAPSISMTVAVRLSVLESKRNVH